MEKVWRGGGEAVLFRAGHGMAADEGVAGFGEDVVEGGVNGEFHGADVCDEAGGWQAAGDGLVKQCGHCANGDGKDEEIGTVDGGSEVTGCVRDAAFTGLSGGLCFAKMEGGGVFWFECERDGATEQAATKDANFVERWWGIAHGLDRTVGPEPDL